MGLLTLPGVFAPISDSWLLADAIRAERLAPGARVLDLCTGSGVLAIAAACEGGDVTAVDVSRRALATTRLNARRAGVRVACRRGRSFAPVAGQAFDLVVSNPPYVPSPREGVPTRGASRAWEAGPDGRLVLDEICDQVADHLVPGGVVLLTHSSLIGEGATIARLQRAGLVDVVVAVRVRGPLGPLMRQQQRVGTIAPDVDEEDVVIVRAVRPA